MSRRPSVDLSVDGAIGVVTINRPDAMNAISGAVADELGDAFREIASRSDIWVMMLRAAGERAFCVGADLKERASFTREDFYANRRQIRGMFKALRAVPQPTIAAVFGFALGGGFELALTCDLIVAAEGTVLGLPEVRVGLMPAGGGTQLLPRLIGPGRAKDLIFSGRRFDATEGREMGLVTRIVPRAELDEGALEIARDICRSSPLAVREAKRAANSAFDVPIEEGIEVEHSGWEHVIESEDRHEGIAAFNEKRDPRWQNR